jgi:hypothetical protein
MSMMAYPLVGTRPYARIRARENREFRAIFVTTFPLFLAVGMVTRAFAWRRAPSARMSVIAEARAAANRCIPFAFMR